MSDETIAYSTYMMPSLIPMKVLVRRMSEARKCMKSVRSPEKSILNLSLTKTTNSVKVMIVNIVVSVNLYTSRGKSEPIL